MDTASRTDAHIAAAFDDRVDDRLDATVGDDDIGGAAGGLGAAFADRDADVGETNRGRVVRAVAGHGHDATRALQRADDAHLLRRRHAREDRDRSTRRTSSSASVSAASCRAGEDERVAAEIRAPSRSPRPCSGDRP